MPTQPRIVVIVPAYSEAALIRRMLSHVPRTVDGARVERIIVVDDCSPDDTWAALAAVPDPRLIRVRHSQNRGVGAAIATGYQRALALGADISVVMAGDDQMDPADLPALIRPILDRQADYVKGNRLKHPDAHRMPRLRRLGTWALAHLTSSVSTLKVGDSQCGYTALSANAAQELPLDELWPRYGYPNDLLLMLSNAGARVAEVPVRPVYADEQSGLKPWHLLQISGVILRRARSLHRLAAHNSALTAPTPSAPTPRLRPEKSL